MFPKEHRLSLKPWPVDKTYTTLHSPHFVANWKTNKQGYLKIAFVVSKKVSKLATERNRAKRKLSHALRDSLVSKRNLNLVVRAKPTVLKANYQTLLKELNKIGQ